MSETKDEYANIKLYGSLMNVVKLRIDAVLKTVALVKSGAHYLNNTALAAEFCLLQLRYCCELLAIGCVAIHKDVPQSKRLRGMWNAHSIVSAFEKLKPAFFPMPVKSVWGNGNPQITQQPVEDELTKKELLKMYHFFGELLHSGTLEIHENPIPKNYDFNIIEDFATKFVTLLNEHVYYLHNDEWQVRIIMNDARSGGLVGWNVMKKVPSPSPSVHS